MSESEFMRKAREGAEMHRKLQAKLKAEAKRKAEQEEWQEAKRKERQREESWGRKLTVNLQNAFRIFGLRVDTENTDIRITRDTFNMLYRGLAKKAHPDMGGNVKNMRSLVEARDLIKRSGHIKN